MNRLQIVQRLRQEAGVGVAGPGTLSGLSGELKRLSDWADSAWLEIQGVTLWDWRWSRPSITLPADSAVAVGAMSARQYIKDTMRLRPNGLRVEYLPWAQFSQDYPGVASEGVPQFWTVRPDRAVQFDRKAPASGAMVFDCEAYASPVALMSDDSVPAMPAEHHMAIVWLALQKYAAHEEAGVLYRTAEREYNKIKRQMANESTPDIEMGSALC